MENVSLHVHTGCYYPMAEKKEQGHESRQLAKRLPAQIIFKLISYLQMAGIGALAELCPNVKVWSAFGQRYRAFTSPINMLSVTEQEHVWRKVARVHKLKSQHRVWTLKPLPSPEWVTLSENPRCQLSDGRVVLAIGKTLQFYSARGKLLDISRSLDDVVTWLTPAADGRFKVKSAKNEIVLSADDESVKVDCSWVKFSKFEYCEDLIPAGEGFYSFDPVQELMIRLYNAGETTPKYSFAVPNWTIVMPTYCGGLAIQKKTLITILHPTAEADKSWGALPNTLKSQEWELMVPLPDGRLFVGEANTKKRRFWNPYLNKLSHAFTLADYGLENSMGGSASLLANGHILETSYTGLICLWSTKGVLLATGRLPADFHRRYTARNRDDQSIEFWDDKGKGLLWQPDIAALDEVLVSPNPPPSTRPRRRPVGGR